MFGFWFVLVWGDSCSLWLNQRGFGFFRVWEFCGDLLFLRFDLGLKGYDIWICVVVIGFGLGEVDF